MKSKKESDFCLVSWFNALMKGLSKFFIALNYCLLSTNTNLFSMKLENKYFSFGIQKMGYLQCDQNFFLSCKSFVLGDQSLCYCWSLIKVIDFPSSSFPFGLFLFKKFWWKLFFFQFPLQLSRSFFQELKIWFSENAKMTKKNQNLKPKTFLGGFRHGYRSLILRMASARIILIYKRYPYMVLGMWGRIWFTITQRRKPPSASRPSLSRR